MFFKKILHHSLALLIFVAVFIPHELFSKGREVLVVNGNGIYSFTTNDFDLMSSLDESEDKVHFMVDDYPVFLYEEGIKRYVEKHIQYPEEALAHNAEGVVLVNFVVERTGEISSPRILRAMGYGCDEEVLRVFENFPKAKPGKIGGKPVRVGLTIPVRFKLQY